MSELAALAGGLLIGYLLTKDGKKVPVYVKEGTLLQQPVAVQVNFPQPIVAKLAGWPTFAAKKVVLTVTNLAQLLLSPNLDCKQVQVRASSTNSATVWLGDSTVEIDNGYPLNANDAISIPVTSEAMPYIRGTAGDKVYYAVVV